MQTTNYYFRVLDIEPSKKMEYDTHLKKEMPVSVWLSYGVIKLYNNKGEEKEKLRFRKWSELREYFKLINLIIKSINSTLKIKYECINVIKNDKHNSTDQYARN